MIVATGITDGATVAVSVLLTLPSKRTVRTRIPCWPAGMSHTTNSAGQRQNGSPSMLHSGTAESDGRDHDGAVESSPT